jgi:hypothetical protein
VEVSFVHPRGSNHKLNWQVFHRASASLAATPSSADVLKNRAGRSQSDRDSKSIVLFSTAADNELPKLRIS